VASLYTVYFDESGTHTASDASVVAGFVSNVTQWEDLSERWRKVLIESGLEYFHMTDFENRQGLLSRTGLWANSMSDGETGES